MNCWAYKKCGREPGGAKSAELGVCPAAGNELFDGLNGGKNGGRICWAVAGTLCGGKVQGLFAMKIESCCKCGFFQKVIQEEGTEFKMFPTDNQGLDTDVSCDGAGLESEVRRAAGTPRLAKQSRA